MESQIRENCNGALDTNPEEFISIDSLKCTENTLDDVRSIINGEESDGEEDGSNDNDIIPCASTTEFNAHIWDPPPPVDKEDDMDSVAFNDDDDEYIDGTKWVQSNGFDEDNGNKFRQERQKAMMEAMNGQFKILVSRFLASENIDHGDLWLDIVASLSWEAASLIKPEANEGRAMDPGSYVKVKCVASGTCAQSEVIRGLVFKKNTAHKHMPTSWKNPRLLLLPGVLGHRESGLSSFDSMDQENDYLMSIHGMIEKCHPNVVLVEKSVSRDIQEFLLEHNMTLVYDMKLTRLNRISRCTGSPIISFPDGLTNPKVNHCDSFHIEKFVEEHNNCNEGGKRSTKTLMFMEGFIKPLGCTILLKGAPIVELKKVKRVLHYTVFAAYHLILETSFFVDQRAFFPDADGEGNCLEKKTVPSTCSTDMSNANISDIPHNITSTGSMENYMHEIPKLDLDIESNENNLDEHANDELSDNPWKFMTSFSSSLIRYLSDSFPPVNELLTANYIEDQDEKIEADQNFNQEKSDDEDSNAGKDEPLPFSNGSNETKSEVCNGDHNEKLKDPESILVLKSSQNVEKGIVCDQSFLSRIKYYGNSDVTLGRFLKEILLNKNHVCSSCNEPPEAHIYCYTHQNGNLTVLVSQLDDESTLSGEAGGKIWMWTRCLKCEHENGIPRSTQRVIMSNEARGLSFGKFLELSFSTHSAASRASSKCGHSLHRDCLRFFGLGSKVAMFRYSPVEIYTARKPPPILNFYSRTGQEWIKKEAKSVLQRGDALFFGVANFVEKLKYGEFGQFRKQTMDSLGSIKDVYEIEDMLIHEKSEFEASLLKAINFSRQMGNPINRVHSLSWLNQELLLLMYIWDQRLSSLLLCTQNNNNASVDDELHEYSEINGERSSENCDYSLERSVHDSRKITDSQNADKSGSQLNFESEDRFSTSDQTQMENIMLGDSGRTYSSKLNDPKILVWTPASELLKDFRTDLHGGSLHKFDFVNSYIPKYVPPIYLTREEMETLYFRISADNSVISVTVSEYDISSFIACALAISENQYNFMENTHKNDNTEGKGESEAIKSSDNLSNGFISSDLSYTESLEADRIHPSRSNSLSISSDELSSSSSESSHIVDRLIASDPEITVDRAHNKCSVFIVHAKEFIELRKLCGLSESTYISSLSRSRNWDAQGGKSKAFFAKTLDDRFIIKEVKKIEIVSFIKFANDYFKHISYSINSGSQTCLAKILGIYQVRHTKGGKEVKTDLMVMENLLYGRNFTRTYDLKGAVFARKIEASGNEKVFLDQNFVDDMRVSPIYIAGRNKHLFQRAIWNDTSFLTSINVMDYSLLVGVDKQKRDLVFGIIDYLRQYTWDKQLETWVKSSLVVPKNSLPTIISPKEYKKRFRKFMTKYFLTVPDSWSSEHNLDPCKFGENG